MKDKIIIGISGKMGSGKTTMTNAIIESLGGVRVSLAKPIYDLQETIYDQLGIVLEGVKDRDLMIALGVWGRNKNPDFWLNQLDNFIEKTEHKIIICDDIRFPNEADYFRNKGIVVRLHGLQRGPNVDHNVNDITETALDEYQFDYYMDNRRSMEHNKVDIVNLINKAIKDMDNGNT